MHVSSLQGHSFLDELPARLIGDKAYDSDKLDRRRDEEYRIEMIAPHRCGRKEPTQDGRPQPLSPTPKAGRPIKRSWTE